MRSYQQFIRNSEHPATTNKEKFHNNIITKLSSLIEAITTLSGDFHDHRRRAH